MTADSSTSDTERCDEYDREHVETVAEQGCGDRQVRSYGVGLKGEICKFGEFSIGNGCFSQEQYSSVPKGRIDPFSATTATTAPPHVSHRDAFFSRFLAVVMDTLVIVSSIRRMANHLGDAVSAHPSKGGTSPLIARKFSFPHEQRFVPIGIICPDEFTLAAYADPQRLQMPTTRSGCATGITHFLTTLAISVNLADMVGSPLNGTAHRWGLLYADIELSEADR